MKNRAYRRYQLEKIKREIYLEQLNKNKYWIHSFKIVYKFRRSTEEVTVIFYRIFKDWIQGCTIVPVNKWEVLEKETVYDTKRRYKNEGKGRTFIDKDDWYSSNKTYQFKKEKDRLLDEYYDYFFLGYYNESPNEIPHHRKRKSR